MTITRIAALVGALCLAQTASGAVDTFLCVTDPPIPGPVTEPKFRDCSLVQGWSEADFLDGPTVEARDLRVGKAVDRASLPLQAAFVNGTVLGQMAIKVRRAGGAPADPHLIVRLLDTQVTSYGLELVNDASFRESLSLRPSRLEYTYFKQRQDGGLINPPFAVMCWDLAADATTTGPCP